MGASGIEKSEGLAAPHQVARKEKAPKLLSQFPNIWNFPRINFQPLSLWKRVPAAQKAQPGVPWPCTAVPTL